MLEEDLEEINKNTLKEIANYKHNNKILDEIIFNKDCYDREEIEFIKGLFLNHNINFKEIKTNLANHQKWLMHKNITDDFLFNNFELELTINKFWHKFYYKICQNEKQKNQFWKNEFLDCYLKQFFLKKEIVKNKSEFLKIDISEINQDLKSNLILSSSSKSNTLNI